jgi:RNA polymerase sigma-70 factor (ECF subfamily)
MTENEAALIRRAKNGDHAAFAEIYDRCQTPIYRYIFYRVDSQSVAEELTSEVFCRLVECIDDFTYRGKPLLAWLYTIARNLVNDHHRHKGKATWVALDEEIVSQENGPEQAADTALDCRRLSAALEQLTEGQRQVILLRFLEGLDNHTVAQILDKSYGAVKGLQHRGLAALRRIMDPTKR